MCCVLKLWCLHSSFKQIFVVPACFDELFIQLCEVVYMAVLVPSSRDNDTDYAYLSSVNTCQ